MNTELLNAFIQTIRTDYETKPDVRNKVHDNPPVAVSWSPEHGIAAMYPNAERCKEAYDEGIEKGQATNVTIHNSGLVVMGQFPMPRELEGCEAEMYTAICTTTADFLGCAYILDINELFSKANKIFLAS